MSDTNSTEQIMQDFGQFLVQQGLLSAAQLASACAAQRQSGKSFAQTLTDLDFLGEEEITRARARHLEIPYIHIANEFIDKSVIALVDPAVAQRHLILPFGRKPDGTLKVAVTRWDAQITEAATKLASTHRIRIAPFLATERQICEIIDQHYAAGAVSALAQVPAMVASNAHGQPTGGPMGASGSNPVSPNGASHAGTGNNNAYKAAANGDPKRVPPPMAPRSGVPAVVPPNNSGTPAMQPNGSRWGANQPAVPGNQKRPSDLFAGQVNTNNSRLPGGGDDNLEEMGVDQPLVIQFVSRILADAINRKASDIHFEPRPDRLDIRYRIDGTLHNIDTIRREFQSACTSRVKIMADMNIAERRLPQDGRISVSIEGRKVDMRVSSLPTQYGESVVLRILDKGVTRPSIEQLGFSDYNFKLLNSMIRKPHGIFLATGPTGSGKTTTLYAAIQAIHTSDVNIITVEDPIEYDLDGIRQSNVHEKAGLTFAKQLRAILRQDPDIIYVGEIRDAETAEIGFRAALTGHLVFSTLHCNDAAGGVTRLLNMEMDPFLVASSVIGIMAQRLVRRVCTNCAYPVEPNETDLIAFGVDTDSHEFKNATFLTGAGCDACDGTGYRGRHSVQEIMSMDDSIRTMVLQRTPSNKIRKMAIAHGMISMRQDAANKVMQGITTFEEAQKRVFIDDAHDDDGPTY